MKRTHPSNVVGWLFVEPVEYQRAMNEQLRQRDAELALDRTFSGEPPAFSKWALDHVAGLAAADQSIARQISERIAKLEDQLSKAETERQRQAEAANAREAALAAEIEQLINLLPLP